MADAPWMRALAAVVLAAAASAPVCAAAPPQDPAPTPAQDPAGAAPPSPAGAAAEELPPPRTEYLGRRIARTMHWSGAAWLTRDRREAEEDATLFLQNLGLRPGMTVCDLGCGNGYHTLRIAEQVGAGGRVYAVDIQPEMLDLLRNRAGKSGIRNVVPVLGGPADPRLPPASCDLVLMADVYHELGYPERVLARVRQALRPGGRLALLEFRSEDPEVPIRKDHRMSRAQVRKELEHNGFVLAASFDGLPWQHLLFFEPSGARARRWLGLGALMRAGPGAVAAGLGPMLAGLLGGMARI